MKRRACIWIPLSLLFVSLAAGCGRHTSLPTAVTPDRDGASALKARHDAQADRERARGRADFFPLTIGNHWRYARSFSVVVTPTGSPPQAPTVVTGQKDARLVSTQTLGGRDYVLEEDVITDDGSPTTQRIYWRQDRTGLYEADVSVIDLATGARTMAASRAWLRVEGAGASMATRAAWSAARQSLERKLATVERMARGLGARPADGTADPDVPAELTRLLYPLHPGAHWDIRTDPLFTSRVEAMDDLDTAAGRFNGWRMRYGSELFGPHDVVHVWYGDHGYLGLKAHLESVAVDQNGLPIGTAVAEQTERLDAIELVTPDRTGH